MKTKLLFAIAALVYGPSAFAIVECVKKINTYIVGTSEVNGSVAQLYVAFEGGGAAAVESKSAAFNGMLSTVIASIAADKLVKIRYSKGTNCESLSPDNLNGVSTDDWIGVWLIK